MANASPITLEQLFRFYRGLPHQAAAISELEEDLKASGYATAMRRDRPWFATWSQAGKQPEGPAAPSAQAWEPAWLPLAAPLVQQFEGLELTAYPDPGTGGDPWTVGYGHTGAGVVEGLRITAAQAEAFLASDLRHAAARLFDLLPMASAWSPEQQAAMVSFTYNVGGGALEASTLRKRLLAGEDPAVVVPAELPRWNKGGSGVLAGLTRRRAAEVDLFMRGAERPAMPRVTNPLTGFPFFEQLDNPGGTGWRECQTSAIAMCLAYLKVPGIRGDQDYLKVVRRHGDTTEQATHQAALAELGVRGRFVRSCSAAQLQAEIRSGLPAALGFYHHGPVGAPSGGGHWISAYGFDANGWIVNDPYGNCDLVRGGWAQQGGGSGRAQRYSYRNFNPRWLAEGEHSGWAWLFS